jgi:integrase
MSTAKATRAPQGIRARHSGACRSQAGERCNCRPAWEAFVFLKREGRKLRKTFPTLAAAKSWRADAMAAANRGKLRSPTHTTLAQAAEEFLAGARDGTIPTRSGDRYKPASIRGYAQALRLRVLPALGDMRLSEVTRADVQDLADRMTAEGLSASTTQNSVDPLRVIFGRAIRRDMLAVDPTEGLELRRPNGHRDRIAAPAEAAALLAALPEEDRALWATAMYAGLRRGELRALRYSDVDLAARVIRVQRGWDAVEGEQGGKSAAAMRNVPILDLLTPELAAHKLRTGRDGDDLVFGRTATEPFVPSTIRTRALAAWAKADLEPIGLHEARHTFASLMIAAGANVKVIQSVMGHATISMTLDHYGHLMPGGLDEAAAAANLDFRDPLMAG